jgi:hypothetical protein
LYKCRATHQETRRWATDWATFDCSPPPVSRHTDRHAVLLETRHLAGVVNTMRRRAAQPARRRTTGVAAALRACSGGPPTTARPSLCRGSSRKSPRGAGSSRRPMVPIRRNAKGPPSRLARTRRRRLCVLSTFSIAISLEDRDISPVAAFQPLQSSNGCRTGMRSTSTQSTAVARTTVLSAPLPAATLRGLSGIQRRSTERGKRRAKDIGIQRRHDPKRSEQISEFVRYGFPWSDLSRTSARAIAFARTNRQVRRPANALDRSPVRYVRRLR